ncbi:hypothetical protein TSST111916_05635 [Tsukamurella strandjordii]
MAVTGPGNCTETTITAEFGASDAISAVPDRITVPPLRCTRIFIDVAELSKACETTSPSWLNCPKVMVSNSIWVPILPFESYACTWA